MEKLFRLSQSDFKSILNKLPVAAFVVDFPFYSITFINEKALTLLNKDYNDTINQSISKIFPEDFIESSLNIVYKTKASHISNQIPFQLSSNSKPEYIYLDLSYQPVLDQNGSINGIIIIVNQVADDLAETRNTEQKLEKKSADLEKANTALQKSNHELEQFAYIASHDLQEPLRKIQFFIDRIEKKVAAIDDSTAIYFDKIKNSTLRMNLLINDLLNFSRLSQSNEKYMQVNLNDIFIHIKSDLELLIHQKNAIITVSVLPTIEAIPLQMQQLFYNLLSNALKFSKADVPCCITIESKKLSQLQVNTSYPHLDKKQIYYQISIRDNGIGFDQQYAEKIFLIFQRLNGLYNYGGTGIGLALCKKIVKTHHGEIFAESKENEGAIFYILLPTTHI